MSLCYDFSKWTIISLASVAITLTIGLVSLAYGQGQTDNDIMVELSTSNMSTTSTITLFAIEGESYREICVRSYGLTSYILPSTTP